MSPLCIRGASANSLQAVDVDLPLGQVVTLTGPSGSGKSSLAFDTIFAEGQRRLVELLSPSARRLAERLPRPPVDLIEGLPPTLACEQSPASWGRYTTVATAIDILHSISLLFIRCGVLYCPACEAPQEAGTVEQMCEQVMALPESTRLVLGVLLEERGEALKTRCEDLLRDGFTRLEIDGEVVELADLPGEIAAEEVVLQVDRLVRKAGIASRLTDSLELALRIGGGRCTVRPIGGPDILLSSGGACGQCGEPTPRLSTSLLSFRSAEGRCDGCGGLGERAQVDPHKLVPDESLSLEEGCIAPWAEKNRAFFAGVLEDLCRSVGIDFRAPWSKLSQAARATILDGGVGDYRGVIFDMENRLEKVASSPRGQGLKWLERFLSAEVCQACSGSRLSAWARAPRLGGLCIADVHATQLAEVPALLDTLLAAVPENRARLAARLDQGIRHRLRVAEALGLGHLPAGRSAEQVSGGEKQRLRLVELLSTRLDSVLFVLDEPSAGLHPQDSHRLVKLLHQSVEAGRSILLVEHDRLLIESSDWVVDMGPGAGRDGGRIVACGTAKELAEQGHSLTGQYLSGCRRIELDERRGDEGRLRLTGASANNLKSIALSVPLGRITCLVGVSGAGKSSLLMQCLLPALQGQAGAFRSLESDQEIERGFQVDSLGIQRSPRSTPATYTGLAEVVRDLYAKLPESRARGFKKSRFSTNVAGGRCVTCKGDGHLRVDQELFADIFVPCQDCRGRRFDRQTLQVRYRGLDIGSMYALTVNEALSELAAIPKAAQRLQALAKVGLGYLQLGQPATSLSGGELQRLVLARELAKPAAGHCVYLIDEPSIGLHWHDIQVLLEALDELVEKGHTVVLADHHLDLMRACSHLVELGPAAGDAGGEIIASGTPAELAARPTPTGRALAASAQ